MQSFNQLKIIILSLFIYGCTDIFINDEQYNSIHLTGGAWIEYESSDLSVLNNDFTLQLWVAGDENESNNGKALITILNNSNEVVFGLFRDPTLDNIINIYLNNELKGTIENSDLNWSTSNFNLITILSDNNTIKLYINKILEFSSNEFDLEIGSSNLIIGAKVGEIQTSATNFWTGYIDEIRLWSKALSDQEIVFHVNNPSKLNSSELGNYDDALLEYLKGLWRFNYKNPQYIIYDESCIELNLNSGFSDSNANCENINGILYTWPGYSAEFSTLGF